MLERGKAKEAIPYFLGAIEADPRFADAYFNLAMAYEGTGDPVRARPCWRKRSRRTRGRIQWTSHAMLSRN